MSAPKQPPSAVPFAVIDELDDVRGAPSGGTPVASGVAKGLVAHVAAITEKGLVRPNNEDALAVVDLEQGARVACDGDAAVEISIGGATLLVGGLLLVVSDGMGGTAAGEVASALVVETLEKQLSAPHGDDAEALRVAVEESNDVVTRETEKRGVSGMGATVVALVIRDGKAITAEVGDSRIYLARAGALTRLTRDQSQAQLLVDRGLLAPEAAARSAAKNILLQACGTVTTLIVAQQRLTLCRGDRLLLCSDGLTTHVPDEEISTVLSSLSSADEVARELVGKALLGGGRDNVTVVVADIDGASLPGPSDLSVADSLETIRAFATDIPDF